MTLTLNLGVADIPYADENGETTGQVAGYLENKYHIMEVFFEIDLDNILKDLGDALTKSMKSALSGQISNNPFQAAETKIEARFKAWLSQQGIDALGIPGVPTQAALDGISHRFAKKRNTGTIGRVTARGLPRPSFIDTGTYQAAFKAWFVETA